MTRLVRVFGLAVVLALAPTAHSEAKDATPPWVRQVPPDRYCLRFGDYDWLRYLRETDAVARAGRRSEAAARQRMLGESLWYLGRGTGRICSCGSKEAVLRDLRRLVPELKKRPAIAYQDMAAADSVEGTIAGIEAEGIAVLSPQDERCKR